MPKLIIILFLYFCTPLKAYYTNTPVLECDFDIQIPEDLAICDPQNVNLNGVIDGDYISFLWEGTNGFSTSSNLTPSVFTSENTTYTLTVNGIIGGNAIVNGDFENGDMDFTTDYFVGTTSCYDAGYLDCEGAYGIVTNPNLGHTNFSACGDHTTGSGNMMVVNGAQNFQEIWCQEISVVANTLYVFSAWATSVNSSSPAILQFSIDGQLLGDNFSLSGTTCLWQEFNEIWSADFSGTVEICITNQNTATSGNDFALDDIFFGEVCEEEMSFDVILSEFELTPEEPDLLTCTLEETIVEVTVFPVGSYTFDWITADGNITSNSSGQFIFVDQGGLYTVVVTDQYDCTETISIVVEQNTDVPSINIIGDFELDCENPTVSFEAIVGASQPDIVWYDQDNNEVGTDFILEVSAAGTYTAEVIDLLNGCTNMLIWNVTNSTSVPTTTIFTEQDLGCANASIFIFSESTDPISIYEWTLPDGTMQSGADLDALLIDTTGVYSLQVIHPNGCLSNATINISAILSSAEILVETPLINCTQDFFQLYTHAADDIEQVSWTNSNGDVFFGDTLWITSADTFFIEAIDTLGCPVLDTVTVLSDLELPGVILTAQELTCAITSVELAPDFTTPYTSAQWTDEEGQVIVGDTITVSAIGQYTLTITRDNGCVTVDSVTVTADINFPELALHATQINCDNMSSTLDAQIDANTGYNLQWIFNNVPISTDETIQVTEEGVYYSELTTDDGCMIVDSVIVSSDMQSPNYAIQEEINIQNCGEVDVQFTVLNLDPGSIVEWVLPDNTTLISNTVSSTNAGIYQVTVTGANGCSLTEAIVIQPDITPPEFQVSSGVINCNQTNTQLTFDSDQDLLYFINDNAVSNPTEQLPGGDFTIVAMGDNGCLDTVMYTIPSDTIAPSVSLEGTTIDCINTFSTISTTGTTDIESYFWQDAQGVPLSDQAELQVDEAGTYSLLVTAANGCTDEASFAVTIDTLAPTLSLTGNIIDCIDTISTIVSTGSDVVSYEWQNAEGAILSDQSQIQVEETGTYSLFVSSENGCTNEASFIVMGNQEPPQFSIEIEDFSCTQNTASIQVISDVNNEIDWLGLDEENFILEVEEQGSYSFELTNPSNGCSLTESIEIEKLIVPLEQVQFAMESNCGDNFVSLTVQEIQGGTPGYSVFVNDASVTMPVLIPEGQNIIQIVDAEGCTLDTIAQAELIEGLEVSDFIDLEVVWQSEQNLSLTTNRMESELASVQWSPAELFNCQNCLEQTIVVEENLQVQVLIEDIYGCTELRLININTTFIPEIYIPNVFSANADNQNDRFTVFGPEAQVEEILLLEIYDRWGNQVFINNNFQVNDLDAGWDGTFLDKAAMEGVYVYHTVVLFENGEEESFAGSVTLLR